MPDTRPAASRIACGVASKNVELAVRGVASEDSDASWGAVDFTELTRTAKRQAAMFESSTEGREVIAQEALARAWEKRHSYQPARGPVEAWLFGLVRNVARERYRDSKATARSLAPADGSPAFGVRHALGRARRAHGVAV